MQFNRYSASGFHLTVSAGIAVVILLGMKLIWFPYPYFQAIDASGLILILVAVDVVIGPLITLIVFDRKKPELKRDLLIVALLQLTALAYGVHVIFAARPAYAVFNVDRFDMVVASEVDPTELAKAKRPEFKSLPLWGPKIIGAKLPTDRKESEAILFSAVSGGADVYQMPRYYVPYTEIMDLARSKALPLSVLRKKVGGNALVDKFISDVGKKETEFGFVPLRGRKKDFSVALELGTGKVAGFLDIDPF